MADAPERIWARRLSSTSVTGIWVSGPPPAGVSARPYVLASTADRDRRDKERLLEACKAMVWDAEGTSVADRSATAQARKAISEIEGSEG